MTAQKANQRSSKATQRLSPRSQLRYADGRISPNRLSISGWKALFISLFLFGLVLWVFLPATRNEFVCYDDTEYVTENPHVQGGLTIANLKWAFTSGYVNWHPLTWISHMVDCSLYGIRPQGHHLTNVLLHALNVTLLFLVLLQMTGAAGRSLAVAALFGVCPLRVESVAWVAERKDVLSGLFFMLMLLAYTQYARRSQAHGLKSRLFYFLSIAMFALGLMSKPMLVTVPFVLLLLDWWPLKRVSNFKHKFSNPASSAPGFDVPTSTFRRLVREKVPYFFLAAIASMVTIKVQQGGGAVLETLPFATRVENAGVSYFRYLGKLSWPVDLAVFYPYPRHQSAAVVLVCGVALVIASFVVILARRQPYLLIGWFWFLGTLVPVIGLVQVGAQSIADRYTYLPSIGILVMIVWGLCELASQRRQSNVALLTVVGAVVTLTWIALTHLQISFWKDSETLFRHAIAVTKDNWVAFDNLGRALGEKGDVDKAINLYRQALTLNPNDSIAHNGLGASLIQKRDFDGAAEEFQQALRRNSRDALAHCNLAVVLANKGFVDEAISHLEESVEINPDNSGAQNNLGALLASKGRFDDAILRYREAIRLKPGDAMAHKNMGLALGKIGQLDEAIAQFHEALKLQPDFVEAKNLLRSTIELKAYEAQQSILGSKR